MACLRKRPRKLKQLDSILNRVEPRMLQLTHTTPGGHAYGEYTTGSVLKIALNLIFHAGFTETDIFLDWGSGSNKLLIGMHFFRRCVCVGLVQCDTEQCVRHTKILCLWVHGCVCVCESVMASLNN